GKVETAIRTYPDVVGTVQQLALVILDDDGHLLSRVNAPQLILLVRTGPEVALAIEAQTVRPPAWLQERGQLAIGAPLQNSVIGLVGEVDVALRVRRRPFRELEVVGQFLEFSAGRNDGVTPVLAGRLLALFKKLKDARHVAEGDIHMTAAGHLDIL